MSVLMEKFPSLFISHGSPMLALETTPASDFLRTLGNQLGSPKSILVISAHWETSGVFRVNVTPATKTIHDFGGFPKALYALNYPAPGSPALAAQVIQVLAAQGLPIEPDPQHGLDHGAWIPLSLMYPQADIPVVQLSLQTDASPETHFQVGQALRALRTQDVLIVASGGATHNLRALTPSDQPAPEWVLAFDAWVEEQVLTGNESALLRFYEQAPFARQNHPSPEHFYPLFVALGAGDSAQGRVLHRSVELGALSMAAYAFN